MKKNISVISIITAVMLLAAMLSLSLTVSAESDSISVTVTISNAGELVLTATPVTVTDADGDGKLTVNDALLCAHIAHYKDGASGYKSEDSGFGLSLATLWGVSNGGSYGYYLNDTSCMSLADVVKQGDSLYAFSYKDLTSWSDMYAYFESEKTADGVTLTLKAAGYDENWAPVTLSISGAVITVDGKETEYVTDADGKVTVPFSTENGRHVISAVSADKTITPPVYAYTVGATGDNGIALAAILALVALSAVFAMAKAIKHASRV